ncbi:hypothetical protein Peur_035715 [Populus x canadensis]
MGQALIWVGLSENGAVIKALKVLTRLFSWMSIFKEVSEECAKYTREVTDKLFTALSLGLGLEGHALKEGAGGEEIEYMLKINYYPPCPRPDLTLGVAAHIDLSVLTILVPDEVPGLQIFKDGNWFAAKHIPN